MYSMAIFFFMLTVFASSELFRLIQRPDMKAQEITGGVLAKFLYLFPVAYLMGLLPVQWSFLVLIPFLLIPINELYRNEKNAIVNMSLSFFPAIYISLPFVMLVDIMFLNDVFDPYPVLGFFILIWVYDTGAYLSGLFLGKNKLFERVSPKKTWEGLIGGAIASAMISYFIVARFIPQLEPWKWLLVALIVVVFGTFGDLIESMIKRNAMVKDSGNLMPGHGGVLDRFDSAIFAAPFFWLLMKLI